MAFSSCYFCWVFVWLLVQGLWSPWWWFHFWGLCTTAFDGACWRWHRSLMKRCCYNVAVFFVTDSRYVDSTWCTAGLCSHLLTSWSRAFWQMFCFVSPLSLYVCNCSCVWIVQASGLSSTMIECCRHVGLFLLWCCHRVPLLPVLQLVVAVNILPVVGWSP